MKEKFFSGFLLLLGLLAFLMPFLSGIYRMSIESWAFFDWLILYSAVYWPTYIIGGVLIAISIKLHA